MSGFGRLERVDLRTGWLSEAQHFTPWLASEDNLALLGETLAIELELEAQERAVGPFRADILCKDTADGGWVLIENQLERTDHAHLGQLITYAAGLQAVTIVWIAARFTEEHRAACDWLNEVTAENIRIFGLEVELWRIGPSPVAPKFNIVSKPNDWSKSVASAKKTIEEGGLSGTRDMQLRYWTAVEELIGAQPGPLNAVKPPAGSWLTHGIGRTGVNLNLAMTSRAKLVRVEIYLTGRYAKSDYAQLHAHRDEIERRLGGAPLLWQELLGKKDSRISLALEPADPTDEADWPRQHKWLVDTILRFHAVFKPFVMGLARDPQTPEIAEVKE
ncbi:protein of unknown function [Paracoccus aminovorans]|uniref:DUF4268 domain-containing protein n=1 Tax=Paracoccus aminovorans TaxID=34004 RepID=A0A1I3A465_9RHOB|nr:DUF4268 domain-containing protein [Paracoccus aminovorans]CQR85000.1 hypothetical protein JCM7685_0416 [Paracoccus aminovorans]SFH44676.1 protein of unknown function [Paracoccus aminovorans]